MVQRDLRGTYGAEMLTALIPEVACITEVLMAVIGEVEARH
jgi:hypothetical protein